MPALSLQILFVASAAMIGTNGQAAPRSQGPFLLSSSDSDSRESPTAAAPSAYLRVVGPVAMRVTAPVVRTQASRPTYPASEEIARDPEAYVVAESERRANGGVAPTRDSGNRDIRISVGADPLPEISVSPYSSPRIHPEDVILFFKDEKLDGLRGGVAYPAARLRFDPAQPEVRSSSSATYTSQ
ncbi:MAG: hypothetical protein R3F07_19945 [Opitutaceae bacterium]